VVVTDVRLPDGTGLDLVRRLRLTHPELAIVVLTMYAGDDQLFAAMEAGASAFVAKDMPADQVLAAAVHALIAPHSFTAEDFAAAMRRKLSDVGPRLSPRELEVLGMLGDGLGITALAKCLHVSESTAKTHVSKIYEKLGAANRAQAITIGFESGLLGKWRAT
jgi:DNA-binding NarL/FixJ family response regulator